MERLENLIYPEADGSKAQRAFIATLKRLRHLVGCKDVLQLSGGCLTLNARFYWVDVWAFECLLGEASVMKEKGLDKI